MDLKKSRKQYKFKGATKILSEHTIDEPNKSVQESNVDSTTSSNLPNDYSPTETTNSSMDSQMTVSNTCDSMLYISTSESSHLSSNNIASASSYNVQSSSANTNINQQHQHQHHQQQQQPFRSPQILPCDLKSLFECPICFDYAVPPIYQCQNGHLVCQACSNKITLCHTCRVPITKPSIRNLQLDRLANTFLFPCKYNFNGCQWKSHWLKKHEHEDSCDFISYSCPCPGTSCKWTGLLSQVMPHLSEHHKSITTLSGEDIVFLATDINLKGAVDWVMIQSCFNHHFLLVLEKQELKTGQQQFSAVVQMIGSQHEAEKFRYKMELVSNVSHQFRRLHWEATPRSILDGIQQAITNYDCLVFDARMAQHFLSPIQKDKDNNGNSSNAENQGENLAINVTIECITS